VKEEFYATKSERLLAEYVRAEKARRAAFLACEEAKHALRQDAGDFKISLLHTGTYVVRLDGETWAVRFDSLESGNISAERVLDLRTENKP